MKLPAVLVVFSLMGKIQWEEALGLWSGDSLWWRGAAQRVTGAVIFSLEEQLWTEEAPSQGFS